MAKKKTSPKKPGGFTDEERAAMRERAQELKTAARRGAGDKDAGERDVLAKIAAMAEPDRGMATRLHSIVKATAPGLSPRTWYGMPAYAKDGQVVCFFQSGRKFKTRYSTLGFSDKATLDDGSMWATGFALKELTPAVEARIAALLKQAVSVVLAAFLLGAQALAQSDLPPTDPKIATRLTIRTPAGGADGPILLDVDIENLERTDIRKNQFSPLSSSVGLPLVRIVSVPSGEVIRIPPGLFAERPDVWDEWYLPASGESAYRVGDFVVPAGARIHLLHGDLRRMVEEAGDYCRRRLTGDTLLAKPEEAATRKEYEDIARFAGQFRTGATYDVTVWAYAQSNTVRVTALPR